MNNKNELLKFPEGLEEVRAQANAWTDFLQGKIKSYSFPSKLNKVGNDAFLRTLYISGFCKDGMLKFKSVPEFKTQPFYILGNPIHNCKWICGSTQDTAN